MRPPRVILAVIAAAALVSCDSAPLAGPPDLRLGRAECAECGMIVGEDRCAAAMLIEREGTRERLIYDDIGCMLDDERGDLGGAVIERWVHDYGTRAWIRAETAVFLVAPPGAVRTPMGSGLVAFADLAAAERANIAGASVATLQQAAEDRRARIEARREAPAGRKS